MAICVDDAYSRNLIPKDTIDIIDAQQFEVFQEKMSGAVRSRLHSWLCLDIRTVISSIEYIATIEIKEGFEHGGIARRSIELNEQWVHTASGWSIKWDGFPGLSAG